MSLFAACGHLPCLSACFSTSRHPADTSPQRAKPMKSLEGGRSNESAECWSYTDSERTLRMHTQITRERGQDREYESCCEIFIAAAELVMVHGSILLLNLDGDYEIRVSLGMAGETKSRKHTVRVLGFFWGFSEIVSSASRFRDDEARECEDPVGRIFVGSSLSSCERCAFVELEGGKSGVRFVANGEHSDGDSGGGRGSKGKEEVDDGDE
ncbi:hypothetical protein B0H10DRAFT_1938052 [Mycena sp. CBHHK59/15]|nr:hypothetical protein B0H10DRAFT_1938052 [Mycena sp. CBHHK59/15]